MPCKTLAELACISCISYALDKGDISAVLSDLCAIQAHLIPELLATALPTLLCHDACSSAMVLALMGGLSQDADSAEFTVPPLPAAMARLKLRGASGPAPQAAAASPATTLPADAGLPAARGGARLGHSPAKPAAGPDVLGLTQLCLSHVPSPGARALVAAGRVLSPVTWQQLQRVVIAHVELPDLAQSLLALLTSERCATHLSLQHTSLGSSLLSVWHNVSHSLVSLDVTGTDIGDAAVLAAVSLPALRTLHAGHTKLTAVGVHHILAIAPHLSSLCLKSAAYSLREGPLPVFCNSAGRTWRCLNLSSTGLGLLPAQPCHSVVGAVAPTLRALRLAECMVDLAALARASTQPWALRALHLGWCEGNVDPPALCTLLSCLPSLRALSLRRLQLDSAVCRTLARVCSQLRSLDMGRCNGLDSADVLLVVQGTPHLQQLDISWLEDMGDSALQELGVRCTQLTHVTLQGLKRITADGCLAFVKSRAVPLRFIDLSWCNAISAEVGLQLAQAWPRLLVLDYFEQMHGAVDQGIPAVWYDGCAAYWQRVAEQHLEQLEAGDTTDAELDCWEHGDNDDNDDDSDNASYA